MELIKDYDCVIDYHLRKSNVVADTLSRKSMQTLRALKAHLSLLDDGAIMVELMARPNLLNQVQETQKSDEKISAIVSQNKMGKEIEFSMNEDGFLYYKDRVCVPNDNELKKSILEEAHCGSFAIHPSSMKNVSGFEDFILVVRNEERCFGFVTKCMVCQKVKAEHQFFQVCCSLLEYPSGNGTDS